MSEPDRTAAEPRSDDTAVEGVEGRAQVTCPTCGGRGKTKMNTETCPECGGDGQVESKKLPAGETEAKAATPSPEVRDDPRLEKRKGVADSLEGTYERRDFLASDMEIRATTDGGLRFTGYASTTETPYSVADFQETIARGAFKRTLSEEPDTVLLINHDGVPLARTRSGTLTLSEDARGLRVDADLDPNNPTVQALISPMTRGDLTEMPLALDTPVPTPTGYATVGELRPGDMVFGSDGRAIAVQSVTPIFLDKECYRVTFSDGEEIVASAEHGWTVDRLDDGRHWRRETVTTAEMAGDHLAVIGSDRRRRYRLPTVALELPERALPVDPYLLGLWLGDGGAGTSTIALGPPEDAQELAPLIEGVLEPWEELACRDNGNGCVVGTVRLRAEACWRGHVGQLTTVRVGGGGGDGRSTRRYCGECKRQHRRGAIGTPRNLAARLREIGVYEDKQIPVSYLRASRAQREALLQGLIDSDGCVSRTGEVIFGNVNSALIAGVGELLSTLGHRWRCSERQAPATYAIQGRTGRRRPFHVIRFRPSTDAPIARLRRKAARAGNRSARSRHRFVVAVERVASVPVRCIGIASEDHLFLAGRHHVPTHNSFAFRATQQEWDEAYENRVIREVSIHRGDVSMVTMGANSTTSGAIAIRATDGFVEVRGEGVELSDEQKAEIRRIAAQPEGDGEGEVREEPAEDAPVAEVPVEGREEDGAPEPPPPVLVELELLREQARADRARLAILRGRR